MRQRHLRRQGHLSPDRFQRLDHLGFEWGALTPLATLADSWDEMFARLVQFQDRFGHCNVPLGWSEDLQLVRWVNLLRQVRKGHLPAERIQWLDALGFKWGAANAK